MAPAKPHRAPPRSYAITPWGAAFLRAFGVDMAQTRRITKARTYFRDRHVHSLTLDPGRVMASVTGSQLDPFTVTIELRTVDPRTVADLLRGSGGLADLTAVARGEQPSGLLEFVAPTEAADAAFACTCPIDDTCIHVLATAFEVAAMIDRDPGVLLTVMGAPLGRLLDIANAGAPATGDEGDDRPGSLADDGGEPIVVDDFFGDTADYPAVPVLPDFNPFTRFEAPMLRRALRATGIAAADVPEATDELAALYDRITRRD